MRVYESQEGRDDPMGDHEVSALRTISSYVTEGPHRLFTDVLHWT